MSDSYRNESSDMSETREEAANRLFEQSHGQIDDRDYSLTFQALRAANQARCPLFKNAKGELQHSGRDWLANDWMIATVGELGEAANVMKKVRRGDLYLDEARPKLAQEFSDVVIYLDMLAANCGVELTFPGVRTFDDFRKRTRSIASKSKIRRSGNDRMLRVFTALGRAAVYLEEVMDARATTFDIRNHLAEHLLGVLHYLDALADDCGINLGEAVLDTFNAKSKQLELNLFLTTAGYVREERK